MKTLRILTLPAAALLLIALAASACFPYSPRIEDPITTEFIHTAAAKTIVAEATLSAGNTAVAQLTQIAAAPATATPVPTATATPIVVDTLPAPTAFIPSPTATLPKPTQIVYPPTWTPIPWWPTLPPPPPPPANPCNWVQFVNDVSAPDGSKFTPGQAFNKTWRLRNIGDCTWTTAYALVFVGGDRMQASAVIPLPRSVRPGETINLGVNLIAPSQPGEYRGYWMLANHQGYQFGIGPGANKPFWVDIAVQGKVNNYPYDFIGNYCSAVWQNSFRKLPCPGSADSPLGSVVVLWDPVLETGKRENEPAIWTRPEAEKGGVISGTFPAYKVKAGDRFMSDIGCLHNSKDCNVTFYLDYKIKGQPVRRLGTWKEVYDGKITRAEVDLSALSGSSVQFILGVVNNGKAASKANAFWLGASIRRAPVPDPDPVEIPAVKAARTTLAAQLGVSPSRVRIISVDPVYWPDTCLGLPRPGQMCAEAVTFGYRVIMEVGGRTYEAHTDETGIVVLWIEL